MMPATSKPGMKAMLIRQAGPPENLHLEELARPSPRANEVLVRVYAAAVNPLDWKLCTGFFPLAPEYSLPFIPGFDISGVIEEVGEGVTSFAVGDEVFGGCNSGGYAEFVCVEASTVAHKPPALDFVQAATIPIGGLVSWQMLFEAASLQAGQRLLIQGAAGGVGTYAVQLAKSRGAYIIGTASARNHDFLLDLGVDEVIDYTTTTVEEALGPNAVDLVLDLIGGETQAHSLAVLKPTGLLVSIVGAASPIIAQSPQVIVRDLYWEAEEQLAEMAGMIVRGELRPVISAVLPLVQAAEAHRLLQAGHVRGKIVLRVVEE